MTTEGIKVYNRAKYLVVANPEDFWEMKNISSIVRKGNAAGVCRKEWPVNLSKC